MEVARYVGQPSTLPPAYRAVASPVDAFVADSGPPAPANDVTGPQADVVQIGSAAAPATASSAPSAKPIPAPERDLKPPTPVMQPSNTPVGKPQAATPLVADAAHLAMVDRLLALPGRPPVSPEVHQHLASVLQAVPLHVLDVVAAHGVHIAVLGENESLATAGILANVDLDQRYHDLSSLAATARNAFQDADRRNGAAIQSQREKVAADGSEDNRQALDNVLTQRGNDAWRTIWSQTHGALDRPFANCGLSDKDYSAAFEKPTTLETLATLHGAQTDDEKQAYVQRLVALNGPLLSELQKGADEHLPVEQRPFTVGDSDFVVPSYHIHHGDDGSVHIYSGHDQGSILNWRERRTIAQYFFSDDCKTLVFRADQLDCNSEGIDTVIHELGHAYDSSLLALDRSWYDTSFEGQWRDVYAQHAAGQGKFPTNYSQYSPQEYFADEFALRFEPRAQRTREVDPEGTALLDAALGRADAVMSRLNNDGVDPATAGIVAMPLRPGVQRTSNTPLVP